MPLIGREQDISAIRAYFDTAGVRGGALLVSGDAGVGKTAVLDQLAAQENGALVLRAAGAQFESEINYSTLNQLLFPLGDEMPPLGEAHRTALRCALGYDVGPVPDRLVVSNAALIWLRAVAKEQPLLIMVDDLHWVDRASAEVLSFVARRLVGSPIVFLGACRTGERGFFGQSGLNETTLSPLAVPAARELVNTNFPDLAPAVRRRLLETAAGNPLALLELPSALDGEQRSDFTTLSEALPLPERLQGMFGDRVRSLPEKARQMLLLGALAGNVDFARLRSANNYGCVLDDLAPAEEARLVHTAPNRLTFRHPLIKAAVVEASSESERRWAHGVIANAVDSPERRVRHLAESTLDPDEDIAAQLEQAAHALSKRGDALGAIGALTRAAELSPAAQARGRRLAEAAYIGAENGGEMATATRLLGDARETGVLETQSLYAAAAAAHLLINNDGDVTTAYRLLAGAVEAGDHGFDAEDPVLTEAMHSLMLISWWVGTEEAGRHHRALVDKLVPAPSPVTQVNAAIFADPATATDDDTAALDELIDSVDNDEDPTRLVRIGTAALFGDRLHLLRGPERLLVQNAREGNGPARRYIGALIHLAIDEFHSGRWDEAWKLCDEGIAMCAEHGFKFFRWYFDWVHALIAAGRGQAAAARQITETSVRWAQANRALGVTYFLQQARALAEIGAGDFQAAYQYATRVSPAGQLARFRPTALWSGLDLVEAALHTGRRAEAEQHAAAMASVRHVSPRMRLLATAAGALVSADVKEFEDALSGPDLDVWPFDTARVRLLYGERLRRSRDTSGAREQLTLAHDVMTALGAVPWRDRAAAELRATGITRQASAAADSLLTPQEREIAELAGSGMTNKQIGEKLFLSHRTVGDHLYKIFPKLGITSRAALRDALTSYDERTVM
ncbi:helix-turn-helix transcriptional regulator [Lentzea sp. JNUCC 0626]|uniref:helix-turn-helix transcriptional regulator n=1 Tax=Lentzea sp. JNUCC 0626 TaxID=3367513 RepID=UPI0037496857